jgi:DNA/RNA-binding domain of Phe-tRNA-synthetase-like protein
MVVTIDPALRAKCPMVALAYVTADVRTAETPVSLGEAMDARVAEILKLPEPRAVLESAAIVATRAGYKALGKDPARYRGSAEALLRRVISGKGLPRINAVVDVINLVSVESRLPIGLYDLAQVHGDVVFRAGLPGETYKGIGKYDLNLEYLPLFADDAGPHGSGTSDSERTMVTATTANILAIIISFAGTSSGGSSALQRASERLSALLTQYAAAQNVATKII